MLLVGITLFLILIGLGFFAYGAFALSKYAFRLGTGTGLLTLLFPPYTFYFAVFKLEEDGKSWPTASWAFGIIVSVLLIVCFWPDLSALMSGDMDHFKTAQASAQADTDAPADDAAADDTAAKSDQKPAEEAKADDTAADKAATGDQAAKDGDKAADGTAAKDDAAAKDGASAGAADKAAGDKTATAKTAAAK